MIYYCILKAINSFLKKTLSWMFDRTWNISLYYKHILLFYKKQIFIKKNLTRRQNQFKCVSINTCTFQARIQRFKEVSQTDQVPGFPLAAAWISRSTSVTICVELSTLIIDWVLISAKSAEGCISVKRLITDLQSILENINNFAACQTRFILTNTRSSRSNEFCCEFCRIFQNNFFA